MASSGQSVQDLDIGRNIDFQGRERELKLIQNLLSSDAHKSEQSKDRVTPLLCFLHGLGGMGKSQIALEYTYRHHSEYDAVFWLQAEQDWTLMSSFSKIAEKLGLMGHEDGVRQRSQLIAIQKAKQWLHTTNKKWLLVFDNVEDMRDLDPYLPQQPKTPGHVVITSRTAFEVRNFTVAGRIEVQGMNVDESVRLLLGYSKKALLDVEEISAAKEVCGYVCGLPLALTIIAGYLSVSVNDLAKLHEILKVSACRSESGVITSAEDVQATLRVVFDIVLPALSDPSRKLIEILAFLDPDRIQTDMFRASIEAQLISFLPNDAAYEAAIEELQKGQLIRCFDSGADEYLTIHRRTQDNVLRYFGKSDKQHYEGLENALIILQRVLPEPLRTFVPSNEGFAKMQKYAGHVLTIHERHLCSEPPLELPLDFARIIAGLGIYMWHAGMLPDGQNALETATGVLESKKTQQQSYLPSRVYQILGIITSFEGVSQRQHSMDMRHEALHSRYKAQDSIMKTRKLNHEDDDMRLVVETDFAYALVQEENFGSAAQIMKIAYPEFQSSEDSKEVRSYKTSQYYQILAVCLMAQKQPEESLKSIKRCIELLIIASDDMHPMTLLMRFISGFLQWHAGNHEEALKTNEEVLEARRKVVGDFSHFTLESYSTCGRLLTEKGDYEKARVYLECCLERRKRAAWNEEGLARAQLRYAQLLYKIGETGDAEKIHQTATATRLAYMEKYPKYLPQTDDEEAVFDQMVSIWSGRFTGMMRQVEN